MDTHLLRHGSRPTPGHWSSALAAERTNVPAGLRLSRTGCWPLYASVAPNRDIVRWSAFKQPHRPGRDYSTFGPFEFDRVAYFREVNRALGQEGEPASPI